MSQELHVRPPGRREGHRRAWPRPQRGGSSLAAEPEPSGAGDAINAFASCNVPVRVPSIVMSFEHEHVAGSGNLPPSSR